MHAAHLPGRACRRSAHLRRIVGVCALLLACAACVHDSAPAAAVSPRTLDLLSGIKGRSLHLDGVGHGSQPVYVADVYVGPNPVTGHGAVVLLAAPEARYTRPAPNAPQGAEGVWYLPVVTDGDAAHLLAAAGTQPPAELAGSLSGAYARTAGVD